MGALGWIVVSGFAMSTIALVGALVLFVGRRKLEWLKLPLVAFAAGSLIGGALLHMLPTAFARMSDPLEVGLWTIAGFFSFLALERLLHWHHCHRAGATCRHPISALLLVADALHNFLGGLAVGGVFTLDVRLGITAWVAAAAHELPQELGDFAVLVHGGWSPRRALGWNFASALTFPVGGLIAYAASAGTDISFLIPFAAGNFLYIGAADLVPEVHRQHGPGRGTTALFGFAAGIVALWWATRLGS